MNALLAHVEEHQPTATRGQKRTLDETQTFEVPAGDLPNGATASGFAALDDWFTGTQFDPMQSYLQPHLAPANASGQDDASLLAPRESDPTGMPNTLLTAWRYDASLGGYSLPPEGWSFNCDEPYNGPEFERLFQSALGSPG